MEFLNVTPDQIEIALRAMKSVAMADGEIDPLEQKLLVSAGRALGVEHDPMGLPDISPEEVARLLPDPLARTRLVQALLVTAMMDGRIDPAELQSIRSFSQALEVDEPRLANLRQLMGGHLLVMKLDVTRRAVNMSDPTRAAYQDAGLKGVYEFVGAFKGWHVDPDLAWQYKQLGLLPEGTLGRGYWVHMTRNRFPLPGEVKGFPELMAKHDIIHVLSGYDTDPASECETVAFISGMMRHDPFSYLFMIVLQEHFGVEVFFGSPLAKGKFDPDRVVRALSRGMRVNQDLYDPAWDFHPLWTKPVEEVRAMYDIA